jgi:hypothetical protein
MFGGIAGGWQRVQAICDYVHDRIKFGYHHARCDRTASEGHDERIGVCRDFAHLVSRRRPDVGSAIIGWRGAVRAADAPSRPRLMRAIRGDLPDDAGAHNRIVSVDLAGKSRPATREISQSLGFGVTLR